ncbi:MAG: lysine 5,6-aminomutase subunit alpha [Candidatus Muiribacteriota bacterium]
MNKLGLSKSKIERARKLAEEITFPVEKFIERHTTVTVERATLRMLGADGVDSEGVPVSNLIVDKLKDNMGYGVSKFYLNALIKTGLPPAGLNKKIIEGFNISKLPLVDMSYLEEKASELLGLYKSRVKENRFYRNKKIKKFGKKENNPLLYVIVATGNIYEDVKQAKSAVASGADIVAVIRTTAQSLLDYVPYGPTTEGFGGTYATQENFKIMRKALDEAGDKENRYIRLVNYCSGLCMPEIAVMGALERLDMMLNDSMYGILFRDINMYRTFVDQKFSRMINANADIIINTGEDNYLTTSDAYEKAYTVLASQLINEKFGHYAGMKSDLIGLGHAFEINPDMENGFLYELAQAQMAREIFPEAPLKYMPPTKYMTGNIFKGIAMNTLFNFVSQTTNQNIQLLGMMTEAIHTPHMHDRYLALENASYVMNNIKSLGEEVYFKEGGVIKKRAQKVLEETVEFLEDINQEGLFSAIENKSFAEISRKKDGGKGFEGVFEKTDEYWNPAENFLKKELNLDR